MKPRIFECVDCNRPTSHDILHTEEAGGFDEGSDIHWGREYHTVRCRGCEAISFVKVSWDSENTDGDGQPILVIVLYPNRGARKPIDDWYYFPGKVGAIYKETLAALSNKAPILGAIGIRAIVEAICEDKGCVAGSLESKIDLLVSNGYLSAPQAQFLHLQRFMGNAAAHEIKAPDRAELGAALDIAENLLRTLYILPVIAENMTNSQRQLRARNTRLGLPDVPADVDE